MCSPEMHLFSWDPGILATKGAEVADEAAAHTSRNSTAAEATGAAHWGKQIPPLQLAT